MKYLLRVSYKDMNTGDIYYRDYDYTGCTDKKSMDYLKDRNKVAYDNEQANEGVMDLGEIIEVPETLYEVYFKLRDAGFPVDKLHYSFGNGKWSVASDNYKALDDYRYNKLISWEYTDRRSLHVEIEKKD